MRALAIDNYKVPYDVIEWAKETVGQPELPDTWRIVRVGFFKFLLFKSETDCLACKLAFSGSYEIEVLTDIEIDKLEALCLK